MKKLKLKANELGAKQVLTREQLKCVMGGIGSGLDVNCPPGTFRCSCTITGQIPIEVITCATTISDCWSAC